MLGAVIGDIAGSRFEHRNRKSTDFEIFHPDSHITDDSVMTIAIARAILDHEERGVDLSKAAIESMQQFARRYPYAGYGRSFFNWFMSDDPRPYNSFGNGAAMRVSPAGWAAHSLDEACDIAEKVTAVSHDHPQSIKAAKAIASAIYMAKTGSSKQEIRDYITKNYYPLDFTLDQIRPTYTFDVSCDGSVPQAFEAFFEASDFEEAVRLAVSIGGDSDTIAAIAGSLSEAYYGIPKAMRTAAFNRLYPDQAEVVREFEKRYPPKIE